MGVSGSSPRRRNGVAAKKPAWPVFLEQLNEPNHMRKPLHRFCLLIAGLIAANAATAQPYSNAVMQLNPYAYWPLQEAAQAQPPGIVATNYGTLGALGNGLYNTWFQPNGTAFYFTNLISHV